MGSCYAAFLAILIVALSGVKALRIHEPTRELKVVESADDAMGEGSGHCLDAFTEFMKHQYSSKLSVEVLDIGGTMKSPHPDVKFQTMKSVPNPNAYHWTKQSLAGKERAAQSFDVVAFSYVLHHASPKDAKRHIVKAKNMARQFVVVTEDLKEQDTDVLGQWHRAAENVVLTEDEDDRDGRLQSDKEWKGIFKSVGFKSINGHKVPRSCSSAYPVSRKTYILEV